MNLSFRQWLLSTLAISATIGSLFSACGGQARDTLETNRALWTSQALTDYSYHFKRSCFCGEPSISPVTIEVHDSEISVTYEDGQPMEQEYLQYFPDIPGLFGIVDNAISKADSLDVQYDSSYGYPTHISVDFMKNAIDDEVAYEAGNLEIL